MGESAKILNPDNKVIMADQKADCPMAHMVDVEKIEEIEEKILMLLLSVILIQQQRLKHILMSV